jgi:CHASE1-domain containing sensor protein
MIIRRRFGDLIDRQLRVFSEDHAEQLARIRATRGSYRESGRDEAEERYGDFADELDWAAEDLAAMRDGYAETLDERAERRYLEEFRKTVAKQLPDIAKALED